MEREKTGRAGVWARWSRVSLRAKGVAALAVPMAALFAALFSIYWAESEAARADATVTDAYDTRSLLLQFQIALLDADSATGDFLASGNPEFYRAGASARLRAERLMADLGRSTANDPASAATLEQLKRATGEDLAAHTQLQGAPAERRAPLMERTQALMAELQARLGILGQAQDLRLFRARAERDEARQRLFRVVLVCGILGPLGALFVHLLLTGRLVRRLQALGENARRLAAGLPLEPFSRWGSDEIAELARQIDDAAALLRERERKLMESERRHRELFDQAPVPYEETDLDGVVRRFNQAVCALLKRTPDQVIGMMAWDFLDPARREDFRAAMMQRIAEGCEGGPIECEYVLDDGSRINVEIRENLISNERGEPVGVCRSLLDVTERNLAVVAARKVSEYAMELRNRNEQLGRALDAAGAATAAKSRFFAGVSHELRTPLNGIIGFSELMHDGKLGSVGEEQRECLADILASARHLLGLINEILDLAKAEAAKMEFRPARCDIEALVNEVRGVVRSLADQKNITLLADVPPGFTAVTDPGRFKQILYNYLSNAVKFTPEGGSVTARVAAEPDNMFRLDVEDTGIGIPGDQIPLLFQEFQQLPNARKAGPGAGLGLALTKHIVEAQRGRVEVRSAPGKGSVFSAHLPLG